MYIIPVCSEYYVCARANIESHCRAAAAVVLHTMSTTPIGRGVHTDEYNIVCIILYRETRVNICLVQLC